MCGLNFGERSTRGIVKSKRLFFHRSSMKHASFNINDINRSLSNLLSWLREAEPDIVCQHELKATNANFPAEAILDAGYHAVWRDERSWNGVAILARWAPHSPAWICRATPPIVNPAISKQPSMGCWSPRSTLRVEIPSPGLNSTISSLG
jgi:hypothetical protein